MFRLTGGSYDAVVKTVEIAGRTEHRSNNVHVGGRARIEHMHDFTSGPLRVGAVQAGPLVDVTVQVRNAEGTVTRGRTYTRVNTNPKCLHFHPEATTLFSRQ